MASRSPTADAQAISAYAKETLRAEAPRKGVTAGRFRFAVAAGVALWRAGRSLVWRFPRAYCWVASLNRDRRWSAESDLWIGGFPHSGQTALQSVLHRAFGDSRVVTELNFPPLIIRALRSGRPGAVAITSPRDAVLSCSAASGRPVRRCLDDYIDFHRALWPYRAQLLFVRRKEVQSDPVAVVQRVERWFALPPTFFGPEAGGELHGSQPPNDALLRRLGHEIDRSPALRAKLRKAERLYRDYAEIMRADAEG